VPATHCTLVLIASALLVPTEPPGLRNPSNGWPASGAYGAGTAVASSSLSSSGAAGIRMRASSTHSPARIGAAALKI